jgi:hypothetical protein
MHRARAAGAAGRFVAAALWRATDPRDVGKALLYAPNKVPGAESACDTDGQNVPQNQKMFQVMEHSGIHQLHNHHFSQEITKMLLKYLDIVTLRIDGSKNEAHIVARIHH